VSLPIPQGAVDAYEALRSHLLAPSRHNGSVLSSGILLRRGMLAWARERSNALASTALPISSLPSAASAAGPCALATELVRLMASLILSKGKEHVCLN
jgi:hypothetical protein